MQYSIHSAISKEIRKQLKTDFKSNLSPKLKIKCAKSSLKFPGEATVEISNDPLYTLSQINIVIISCRTCCTNPCGLNRSNEAASTAADDD